MADTTYGELFLIYSTHRPVRNSCCSAFPSIYKYRSNWFLNCIVKDQRSKADYGYCRVGSLRVARPGSNGGCRVPQNLAGQGEV